MKNRYGAAAHRQVCGELATAHKRKEKGNENSSSQTLDFYFTLKHSSTLGFEGNSGEKKKVKRVWRENGGRCSGVLAVHLLSTDLQ